MKLLGLLLWVGTARTAGTTSANGIANNSATKTSTGNTFQCNEEEQLAKLIRSAYSRLLAVHCSTGESEAKTKRLSHIFNPIDANNIFCDSKLDTAQMHEALFGIQSGLGENGNDSSRIDYLDGTKRTRLEIGHYVYQNYRNDVCLDEAKVLGDIEMVLSRYRDQSEDYRRLFGIHEKLDDYSHQIDVRKIIQPDRVIYSLYNTIETSYDVLDNVVDLNQIFDVVKAAKESTQIWLIVKTSFVSNQSLAVAISALAQTKELEINVVLVDPDQIPRDMRAIWRSMSRSTYGTLYQVPEALLYQLSPVISDGLSTDFNLIETETFEEEAISLDISVDASVRKLMIELTGNNLPEIIRILAPDGSYYNATSEIKFTSLRYLTIESPAEGNWSLLTEADSEIHVVVSALALFRFKTSLDNGGKIETHSIHDTSKNGHDISVGKDVMTVKETNDISYINLDQIANGEIKLHLAQPEMNLKRIRRATKPVFHQLSNTTELVPGRTNVIFLHATLPVGETIKFAASSTNPSWKIELSPESSNRVSTDVILSISVPFHSKSGTSGSVTLSASNDKLVIGSKRIDLFIGEDAVPETRNINVNVDITNRFANTKMAVTVENNSGSVREAPFRAIIPSGAFVKSFKIKTADGKEYKSKIVAAQEDLMPQLKFSLDEINEPATAEQIKRAKAATPVHHAVQQEAMIVDIIPITQPVVASVYEGTEYTPNQPLGPNVIPPPATEASEAAVQTTTINRIVQVKQAGQHLLVHATVDPFANLTYELEYMEVLERNRDIYRYGITFDSEIPAHNLDIEIKIKDTNSIKSLRATPRQSSAVRKDTKIVYGDTKFKSATINFSPIERDDRFWFGIEYDVIQNGCSTVHDTEHFITRCRPGRAAFPAAKRTPFGVNIIFVIDGSGSMWGERIEHARKAFKFMLEDLKPGDTFNVIMFDSEVRIFSRGKMVPVNDRSVFAALKFLDQIQPGGGTNIYAALVKGLIVLSQQTNKKSNSIMFLTDGTPTAGVLDLSTIVNTVHFVAKQNNIAINSIAFGQEVNHEFLTQISAQTNGMVLKVPVRPDAAYMMQDFYFETIARLQKSSGINDPIVNLLDQHKNYIDFFPYTEYSRLSYGEEIIVAGAINNYQNWDNDEHVPVTQVNANVYTTEGQFDLASVSILDSNCSEYYNSILAHRTLVRRDKALDDEYDELTADLVAQSLTANILTPVVSLQILKPSRNRRSSEPMKEIKFKFRRLTRPTKRIDIDLPISPKSGQDLADFDEPEISFHDKIVTIVKPNLNICFSLPERTESDELILVRSSGLMVTGLVNSYGLYEIRIHDGSGYIFNITKLGLQKSLAKAQMIQSGNFFVFEQKIQFLLNNGLKFEVEWGQTLSLNVLNTGKQAAGLISTLDSINGSRVDPSGVQTRNIPIEIMGFYTIGDEISVKSRNCIMVGDLDQFLSDAEESGLLL